MLNHDTTEVTRDCEAMLIPSGVSVTLKKGSLVMITQALGNSYTVYVNGNLARIAGKDGDALGMIIYDEFETETMEGPIKDRVWAVLSTCFDPEIPVNIVDLGLVYECKITGVDDKNKIEIKMTLTAPGCGMGPVLVNDIKEKLNQMPDVGEVAVELVFDPPWDRSMMSDVGKLQLGML